MHSGIKSYQTNSLAGLQARAGANISGAIQNASARTGVDFSYLLKQADVESSFNPSAKARSSSATGLFQFIESTWLSMVKKYGDKYGLGDMADKISDSGKVASRGVRAEILALRKNPEIASLLAGEYASENKSYLQGRVGGEIGSTELYMAHFMGADGAGDFLEAMNANPDTKGAALFKRAACANPNIFYDRSGNARSLEEIYAVFDTKFDLDQNGSAAATQYAAADTKTGIRPDFFDEVTGRWITFKPRQPATASASAAASQTAEIATAERLTRTAAKAAALVAGNLGGIPGYGRLIANPVDIMSLLNYGQSETDKKSNLWG